MDAMNTKQDTNWIWPVIVATFAVLLLGGCKRLHEGPPHHEPVRVLKPSLHKGYTISWYDLGDAKTDRATRHANADELIKLGRPSQWGQEVIRKFLVTMNKLNQDDPFWGVRLAIFELQVMRDRSGLTNAMKIAKNLSQSFPENPDSIFLRGYVSWFALAQRMVSVEGPVGQDLLKLTVRNWDELISVAPNYRGPGAVDVAWIKHQNKALRAKVMTAPKSSP
jgi:hypothetical protein